MNELMPQIVAESLSFSREKKEWKKIDLKTKTKSFPFLCLDFINQQRKF